MSRPVVFLGPTLPVPEARTVLAADYRPPAAQGDLYRAAREGAVAIGLVDAHFERVPTVWHKEILWALRDGVPVYGAASMGALRAVECAPWGMVGVGRIFEAYRDGLITADDAVAVAQTTGAYGYRATSTALVDLVATLVAASVDGVLTARCAQQLIRIAGALWYPERTWRRLMREARAAGVDAETLDALSAWWPVHAVHQKREDALAMLRRMRADLAAGRVDTPRRAFDETTWWREAAERWEEGHGEAETETETAHEPEAVRDVMA